MRSLKSLYTIPAHRSNVADVKFFQASKLPTASKTKPPKDEIMTDSDIKESTATDAASAQEQWSYRDGLYLASAGYDGLVKLWSADDWQLLRTLTTDGGKVMSVDLSRDGKLLASGTYNRNFQLFAPE